MYNRSLKHGVVCTGKQEMDVSWDIARRRDCWCGRVEEEREWAIGPRLGRSCAKQNLTFLLWVRATTPNKLRTLWYVGAFWLSQVEVYCWYSSGGGPGSCSISWCPGQTPQQRINSPTPNAYSLTFGKPSYKQWEVLVQPQQAPFHSDPCLTVRGEMAALELLNWPLKNSL